MMPTNPLPVENRTERNIVAEFTEGRGLGENVYRIGHAIGDVWPGPLRLKRTRTKSIIKCSRAGTPITT
jgi:hypothetical protein